MTTHPAETKVAPDAVSAVIDPVEVLGWCDRQLRAPHDPFATHSHGITRVRAAKRVVAELIEADRKAAADLDFLIRATSMTAVSDAGHLKALRECLPAILAAKLAALAAIAPAG